MKRLIAVFLGVLLVFCVCGCGESGNTAITARAKPLEYGINAHIYEQRPMDPSATMDYIVDMTDILDVTYYRLSTPHDSLFTIGEGDTLTFKDGFKDLVHKIIEKMTAVGVTHFVAVSDAPIYPYGYRVTSNGVVPDPLIEKDMYLRWVKLYAKAWGMIAKEFPEITHIEPMNEPDLPGTNMFTKQGHLWGADDGYRYNMTDKAHMIADLQYYIYKEVKNANSNALVTTPGFSTYGEAQDILDYLYEAIESGAHPYGEDFADTDPDHYFDCINFHKYLSSMTLDEYFEHCDNFYRACERHNDAGKPAIITEWGFTDHDNEGQEQVNGENMTKQLEMFNEKMPYLEAVIVYMLSDYYDYSVDSSEDNFGLFASHGDPEKRGCPKPVALEFYKYIHKTDDVTPLYKYCPELMK